MNLASVLDQLSAPFPLWPAFPMWLPLAAAGFFGLILLVTVARADRWVANVALTLISLLAIGVAAAGTMGAYGPTGRSSPLEARSQPVMMAALPALSCIDDLAGETILSACEKALFGSPESVAAAVSYTSAQIGRLTALGDSADAAAKMTPELRSLRRALERDRYGLVAQALVGRDNCTRDDCAAFRSLTDHQRIVANMDAHLFDDLVARYSASWNTPTTASAMAGPLGGLPPSMPTGRPTNAEFPSAASTPAVSIMAAEPPARQAATGTTATTSPPRSPAAAHAAAPPPAPKKSPATKKPPGAPAQIAPRPAPASPATSKQE